MRLLHSSKGRLVFLCLFVMLAAGAAVGWGQGLVVRPPITRSPRSPACRAEKGGAKFPSFADVMPSRPRVEAAKVTDAKTTPIMAQTIRKAYEALVRYAEPSGKDIAFQLSNFRTYGKTEFDFVRWFDLVSMPGGDAIQVESRTHQASSDYRLGRTEYVPQWRQDEEYGKTKEGEFASGLSVRQAFQAAVADEPRLAAVSQLTAYDVTVTLEGRSRTYHAAFLWIEEREGLTMLPYDYVTGRVADGLVERFPPGREAPRLANDNPGRAGRTKENCVAGEVAIRSFGLSQASSSDHYSGNHSVDGAFSADCVCNADCSQDCTSNGFGGCNEWGDVGTFYCHRISDPGFASADSHVSTGQATCKASAACSWKSCFACLCGGASVSVSYNGVGFSVSTGASGAAAISKESSFQCPPCPVEPPPPPPPPPGGGGGDDEGGGDDDGGGGGGICEEGSWVTEWECIFVCGGWSDGEFCWVDPNAN